jgi:hypothetical protein
MRLNRKLARVPKLVWLKTNRLFVGYKSGFYYKVFGLRYFLNCYNLGSKSEFHQALYVPNASCYVWFSILFIEHQMSIPVAFLQVLQLLPQGCCLPLPILSSRKPNISL